MLIALFIFSCNNSDDNLEIINCKITKHNKINTQDGDLYLNEFIYDNNNIIKYLKKDLGNNIISTEDIEYINNLPVKIIQNENEFLTISYNNNIIKDIIKTKNFNNGYIEKYIYKFTFESNKPIKIESFYLDNPNSENTIQLFEYSNQNLIKIEKTTISEDRIEKSITNFSNYDNRLNPYNKISIPFLDLIPNIYSKNNYQKIDHLSYLNGELIEIYERSFELQYDSNGYPKYAEYNCN